MKPVSEMMRFLPDWFFELPYALIDRQLEQKFRWLSIAWIVLLYGVGIYFWSNFLNWTRTPLDFQDWGVINSPRLDFFSDALRSRQPPLHMVYQSFDGQEHPLHITDRFFLMPDVITTPQSLLLAWLSVNQFVLLQLLTDFTLATLGLLWFRRRYGLSLLSYGILFLLFNFNGYLQSHYGIGHITWGGYFLFPLFLALIIQLIDEQPNWVWVGKVALLFFYMLLAGSQHHMTWALIFMGILAITSWDKFKWIIYAGLFSGLLGAVRLLPPVLILQDIYGGGGNRLLPGYPTVLDVWGSLVTLVQPSQQFVVTEVTWLSHWEFDIYIGLVGASFLLYFGGYRWIKDGYQYPSLQKLLLPTVVIFILTIGKVYSFVRALHIPLLDGERVPSRLIGLPLAVIILIAVIYFQKWLDHVSISRSVLLVFGFLVFILIANDVWAHSRLWNVNAVREAFGPVQMVLTGSSVGNRQDQPYVLVLLIGLLTSIATGLFLLFQIQKERRLVMKYRVPHH